MSESVAVELRVRADQLRVGDERVERPDTVESVYVMGDYVVIKWTKAHLAYTFLCDKEFDIIRSLS